MNVSLPYPIFPLLCASLAATTFMLAIAAFITTISLSLWIIPAAFITSFALHAIFLLLSNTEDNNSGSLRVFSAAMVSGHYAAAVQWGAATTLAVFYTVKLLTGSLTQAPNGRAWAMVTASVVSLLETVLMSVIAVHIHKVRRRLRYREKWRWRPGATTSQWSIAQA